MANKPASPSAVEIPVDVNVGAIDILAAVLAELWTAASDVYNRIIRRTRLSKLIKHGVVPQNHHNLEVKAYICNRKTYALVFARMSYDVYDPTTHRELLEVGIMGHLWGATVIVRDDVPDNVVKVSSFDADDYLARIK